MIFLTHTFFFGRLYTWYVSDPFESGSLLTQIYRVIQVIVVTQVTEMTQVTLVTWGTQVTFVTQMTRV